jgi:hypothetical protein
MSKIRDQPIKKVEDEEYVLSAPKLLEYEIGFLQKMAIISWPSELSEWKRTFLQASKTAENSKSLNLHISFRAADPRAAAAASMHYIELGGEISGGTHPQISYFFAIGCDESGGYREGLRKLHFDVDPVFSDIEPKPIVHIQFPGRMSPKLVQAGYKTDAFDLLHPKLDKPRIPSIPTSFALLVHWAFLEYHMTDPKIGALIAAPEWLSIVNAAEKQFLTPYFRFSQQWRQRTENEKRSLLSYFYGLPRP